MTSLKQIFYVPILAGVLTFVGIVIVVPLVGFLSCMKSGKFGSCSAKLFNAGFFTLFGKLASEAAVISIEIAGCAVVVMFLSAIISPKKAD